MNINDYSFVVGEGVKPLDILNDEETMEKIKILNFNLKEGQKNV